MEPQQLFDYGIQLERSDIRIHVSFDTRRLYVFQTAAAQKLLEERGGEFAKRPAYQADVPYPTAIGWLVPCNQMPTLRVVLLSGDDWWESFDPAHDTSRKGARAAELVERALREGLVPLPFGMASAPQDTLVQRKGVDIFTWGHWRIQVKCDWIAGPVAYGGSGNLFLQEKECNPKKRY